METLRTYSCRSKFPLFSLFYGSFAGIDENREHAINDLQNTCEGFPLPVIINSNSKPDRVISQLQSDHARKMLVPGSILQNAQREKPKISELRCVL